MYIFERKMLGFSFFHQPWYIHFIQSIRLTVKCLPLSQPPEPMYTEGDVKALKEQHTEEIQLLQEEYE